MWNKSMYLLLFIVVATLLPAGSAIGGFSPNSDASLIIWYKLDEMAGVTAVDSGPGGHDGTVNGDAEWVAGWMGGALQFNGSNTYVDCGDDAGAEVTDGLTVTAWINVASFADWRGIVTKGTEAAPYAMQIWGGGLLRFSGNWGTVTGGSGSGSWNSTGTMPTDEWVHAAITVGDGLLTFYIDSVPEEVSIDLEFGTIDEPLILGADFPGGDEYFDGAIDDVRICSRVLLAAEVQAVMLGLGGDTASDPIPDDEQDDVPRDVILSWTAGTWAATHDVYLGTNFDDVNTADRDNPSDVLVSEGQAATTYDPVGLLEFSQTYYWRVDEVNAAPDSTIFKGDVWSFTTEPVAYPIENIIATCNGTWEEGSGPEKTVDGSGLADDDTHSAETTDMWAATTGGVEPVWIQYEFDKVYKLYELLVWNYNVSFESLIGFGFNDVTIEYSENGTDWTVLAETQFARGISMKGYAANTVVDLEGVAAQYVRLTANSNFGTYDSYGLSEVRFLYTAVQAREPDPADGATDVSVDTLLDWRSGREAASHDVYLGTEAEALSLVGTVTASQYDPAGLDLSTTYYWQIDEVNETTGTWEGDLWNFTTQAYILVDNFESYTDNEGSRIYETWEDGWVNGTGSTVGYLDAPFAEQTIVHGGRQAMPLMYDGDSEADLPIGQNWTENAVTTLTLFFYGDLENDAAEVYVKIGDTRITGGGSTTMAMWKQWNIDLASTGANLSNVATLTIGIEGSGSGTIYVDDIRLYRAAPAAVEPVDPGTDNLILHYAFENDATDSSGNGYDGVPMNNPFYDDAVGDLGRAMSFDGINDYVELPIGSLISTLSDMSVATWINLAEGNNSWQRIFDFGSTGSGGYMFLAPREGTSGPVRFAIEPAGGSESVISTASELWPGWHHVAVTIDSASMTASVYIDGIVDGSGDVALLPRDLGVTTQNWIGRSQYEADGYLEALLADFSIYERTLSAGEVNYLAGGR